MFTLGPTSSTPWEPPGTIFVTQVFDELCKRVSTELDRKLSTQTSCWEVVRSAEWTRFDKLVNTAKKNIWGAGKSLKVSQNQVHKWAAALSCSDNDAVQFIKTVLECIRDHPGNVMDGKDEVEMIEIEKVNEEEDEVEEGGGLLTFRGQGKRWGRQRLPGAALAALQAGVFKTNWFIANTEMLEK